MAGPNTRATSAETEAAAWHSRLGERSVSTQTIEDFYAWRSTPEHDAAYRRVETAWAKAGELAGDPAINTALYAARSRRRGAAKEQRRPRTMLGLAAVAGAAALAFGGWSWLQTRTVFSTNVGEQELVQLADGSSVRLDTGSRIRVRFDGDRRRIDLEQGQAMFIVAHDAARPFEVDAGGMQVIAVGTVFDVRREGAGARVTLVSGVVDVVADDPAAPTRMEAGRRARVLGGRVATEVVDAAAETSWTEGRIVFRDTSLRQAVAEVNRYLTDKIVLDATTPGDISVNGVFRAGDREAFVATASRVLGLQAATRADGAVILSARTNN